jgi:glycine oxidase
MRVTVVGAGVVGLTTATELCERGAEVTIVERSAELGDQACSWVAGGMLAPYCEGESAPQSVVERGATAIDWWAARVPGVARHGTLVVAPPRDSSEIDRFAARTRQWRRVDEAAIAGLESDLAGRFRKGLFFAGEGHLDPRVALTALRDALLKRGATFRFGVDGEAACDERVMDCRGFAARKTLPELRGVRGEMLLVRSREISLRRPVRLLHPRIPLYIAPRADGIFMIGATMIESADDGGVSVRSAIELLSAAYALHPAFGEAEILEMRADVRPAFPDNEPRIVERGGRIFVNGFYRHGFLLSPAFAEMAAERVFARDPPPTPPREERGGESRGALTSPPRHNGEWSGVGVSLAAEFSK